MTTQIDPIRRACVECEKEFTITVGEVEFLQQVAAGVFASVILPRRRLPCRSARRRLRYETPVGTMPIDEILTCIFCQASFILREGSHLLFRPRF
jgi:hypothetical protein